MKEKRGRKPKPKGETVKQLSVHPKLKDAELLKKENVQANQIFQLGLNEWKKQNHPDLVVPNLRKFNEGKLQERIQDYSSLICYSTNDRFKQKPLITDTLIRLKGQQLNRSQAEVDDFNSKIKPFIEEAWKNKRVYAFEIACDDFINGKKIKDIDFESYGDLDNFYIVQENSYLDNMIIQFQNNEKYIILFPDKESEHFQKQEALRQAKETQLQHLQIKKSQDEINKRNWIAEQKKIQDEKLWRKHKKVKENPKLKKLIEKYNELIESGRNTNSQTEIKKIKVDLGKLFIEIMELNPDFKSQPLQF